MSIKPRSVSDHDFTPRWELRGGDVGDPTSPLPPSSRVLVQIVGDLMGGRVSLRGGMAAGDDVLLDTLRGEGVHEILPLRRVTPSFDGPVEASITVTIMGIA